MLDTIQFGEYMKNEGYDFYTGVPCSWMKNLINYANNECDYYNAPNEGDAVALASGAYLAGRRPVVLMQNSGLGNAISPLTSLNYIFEIPILIFVSMRQGSQTTPQHELMENISADLVKLMKMDYVVLSKDFKKATAQIKFAQEMMDKTRLPFFIFVEKDTFSKVDLNRKPINTYYGTIENPPVEPSPPTMKRYDVLKTIQWYDTDTIFLATTGMTGRELCDITDKPNNFYMVGSMGCVASIGLGIALNTKKKVVVIDGDGAAIMRMSAIPMVSQYQPHNLLHILLDNNVHDSTGGQATLSNLVPWVTIAAAMGYTTEMISNNDTLENALEMWHANPKLKMLVVPILTGSKDPLGRPEVSPRLVKERLMNFIKH